MDRITITIKARGPCRISAEQADRITILDDEGREYQLAPGKAIVLCRCGHSANKPFCDATHKLVDWQSALRPVDGGQSV